MTARQQPTGDNKTSRKSTEHNLPLFAQPVNGSKFPVAAGKQDGTFWSRPITWTMAVIACSALLSLARPDKAQNSPATRNTSPAVSTTQNRTSGASSSTGATNSTLTIDDLGDALSESRRSVDFYTQAVRSNMFTAPALPTPPAPKQVVVITQPAPQQTIKVPPVVINPFAEWSYTGVIKSDDQITALVENTRTKEGQFLKAGDTFMGAQITNITDQEIVLKSGKTSQTLAKSDNITVTPLDRSAIPTNAQGQGQAGQQPNAAQLIQQAMQMATMGNMQGRGRNRGGADSGNGQTFTLPNGRQLNQQQFQRRSQGLNRGFNQ